LARIVNLAEAQALPKGELRQQAYNALDCTGTLEILENVRPLLEPHQERIYRYQMALQNCTLSCMAKGIRVDLDARKDAIAELKKEQRHTIKSISVHPLVREVWDLVEKNTGACKKASRKDGKHKWPRKRVELAPAASGIGPPQRFVIQPPAEHNMRCEDCGAFRLIPAPFNANSPDQVAHLFYDLLGAPKQKNKQKKISTDEDCLLRIAKARPDLADLIDKILSIKDLAKQLGFLECELSPDNRFMFTLTAAGAWTGRMASKASPLTGMDGNLGSNVQNISERHRHILIPDAGKEIGYVDLAKAESHIVAYRSGDELYMQAHDPNEDTHTFCARLLWPDICPWSWDIQEDKKLAKNTYLPFDVTPGHDIRFYCKKFQHGSNFGLTPLGIAAIHKVPVWAAKVAQKGYFEAFPMLKGRMEWMAGQVAEQAWIENPLGRKIKLMGRPWDKSTWRKALAFDPQSCVGDYLNAIFYRLFDKGYPTIDVLSQCHDALLMQWDRKDRDKALELIRWAFDLPLDIEDYRGTVRRTTIPCEIAIGSNWGHKSDTNPRGLTEHF
jgi:hypothetical protein